MISDDIGIIGYGSTPYHKKPQRTLFGYVAEAARNALQSAGITKHEIDGLAVDGSLGADTSVSAAEHLGLTITWAHRSAAAGAGTIMGVAHAVRAVEAGLARYALCIGVGAQDVASFKQRISSFTAAVSNYLAPHGYGGPPGMHALIQRKHMATFGTTRKQLGRIAVDQRFNAGRNEAALLRTPLLLEQYLDAKIIADPLRLYDCVMPCSGAEAVLVGPLDRVPVDKRVRILAARECHNHRPRETVPVAGGWEALRDRLFQDAGRAQTDMDFMQCYDDFPIVAALQIEDLGFCRKGEVGPFLAAHRLTYDGTFPLNTGGGQLSCGQAGSGAALMGVVEAVRQLRGEGGSRQVVDARRGIVSGYGMISYGHGLSASALILERA